MLTSVIQLGYPEANRKITAAASIPTVNTPVRKVRNSRLLLSYAGITVEHDRDSLSRVWSLLERHGGERVAAVAIGAKGNHDSELDPAWRPGSSVTALGCSTAHGAANSERRPDELHLQ